MTTRTSRPTRASALVIAAAIAACGGGAPLAPQLIPAASAVALPALEYKLLSGETWASSAAAGKVLVLDVWATFCAPCKRAFPKLGRLAATYPDAVVVGVSVDHDDAVVRAFLATVPAGFAIARDPGETVQSGPLQLSKLPALLVVDRRGRVRYRAQGIDEGAYDALPGMVAALLAE